MEEKTKIYVIQRHQANRLHFDLRLEMGGVLKSWAISKSPPKIKGTKRLAIQTDDHKIEYADFEGETEEVTREVGFVKIWDKGTYEIEIKEEDKYVINLNGKKLKGSYCLIKIKRKGNYWLFFKL